MLELFMIELRIFEGVSVDQCEKEKFFSFHILGIPPKTVQRLLVIFDPPNMHSRPQPIMLEKLRRNIAKKIIVY